MKRLILAILVTAALAAAAGVEGRWTSEITSAARKQPKKGGPAGPTIVTLNLKTSGGQLTGTVDTNAGKRSVAIPIQDGKLNGDSFSFTTVQKSKKAESKWSWRGTVKGDELTGTRTRDGARRGQSFTAKRSN
jgi:hypothetical protein